MHFWCTNNISPSLYGGKCKQSDNDLLFCRVALAKASLWLILLVHIRWNHKKKPRLSKTLGIR